MAWPLSPLTTYVPNSTPVIKADDLNKLQEAINRAFGALWSFKALAIDGTGGLVVAPAAGLFINTAGPIEGDGASGDGNPGFQTLAVGATTDPSTSFKRKLVWLAKCDATNAPVYVRIYSLNSNGGSSSGVEITVNCYWDAANTRWNQDAFAPYPVKLTLAGLGNSNLQLKWFNNGGGPNWLDTAWTKTFTLDPTTVASLNSQGVTGTGTMDFVVIGGQGDTAFQFGANSWIYGSGHFRKAFPSTPSNLTYIAPAVSAQNVKDPAAVGILFLTTSKWGVLSVAFTIGNGNANYQFHAIAS